MFSAEFRSPKGTLIISSQLIIKIIKGAKYKHFKSFLFSKHTFNTKITLDIQDVAIVPFSEGLVRTVV